MVGSFDYRNGMAFNWKMSKHNRGDLRLKENSEITKFLNQPTETTSIFEKLLKSKLAQNTEYVEKFIEVKVDHFAFDNSETFKLRFLVNDKKFNLEDPKSPILFYAGNEGPIEGFYENCGWITETLAQELGGLILFGEHRFFGQSFPFGGQQDFDIKKNKFLTVEQALADFDELIYTFKKENGLESHPVIVFGGSYGGMLAAWGRMKFPHVYAGAIASSAPILLFENTKMIQDKFFRIITNTYRRYNEQCPILIKSGFDALEQIRNNTKVAANPSILQELNDLFKPCKPIANKADIGNLASLIEDAIEGLAQYNYPYPTFIFNQSPGEPVKIVCENIIKNKESNTFNLLPLHLQHSIGFSFGKFNQMNPQTKSAISYLKEAVTVAFNYTGDQECLDIGNDPTEVPSPPNGWEYLACTEMVMPLNEKDGINDMFTPEKWNEEEFENSCKKRWSADVRPTWAYTYFGGRNFSKEINSYSNIVFTNGNMDPWNAGCPKDSHNPKVIVMEADSAHHLDLRLPHEKDPQNVNEMRRVSLELIKKWIKEY
jgi:lysosomal Pro-X carboxypeptidase